MKSPVIDIQKKQVGDIDLDDSVFGAPINEALFWDVVKMQMANRRRGTQSTKTVSEVSGTGKKPYKQKGTGRARQGSLRSAQMRGGGVVLGPKPRDYSYKLPKKMVQGALRSALSLRMKESKLLVVKDWAPKKPKTKEALAVFTRFEAKKALVIGSLTNESLAKSIRNLNGYKFLPVSAINVRDILNHDLLILGEDVVAELTQRLKTAPSRKQKEQQSNA